MANNNLFKVLNGCRNEAGGVAYDIGPKASLSILASTSCLNNTLYVTAQKQLDQILRFAYRCDLSFIAKVAVYSREKHRMKDVPALLCAILATNRQTRLLEKIFPRIIDDGDMLRNFVQIIRSGTVGRRSFGTVPKRLITNWFNSRTPTEVFDQSVGKPSMSTILRLIRPKPLGRSRRAMYGWFLKKNYEYDLLPEKVKYFEHWKSLPAAVRHSMDLPNVDFRRLTNQPLSAEQWATIARRAGWKWLLKNLKNMTKHGVFRLEGMPEFVADRLSDRENVLRSKAFPYQILVSYEKTEGIPTVVRDALHVALEVATENVPTLPEPKGGNPPVYLLVDVSRSMTFPVTGERYGRFNRATTKVTCADVAALIACCILRQNKNAELLCFNTSLVDLDIDPTASVMDNATRIAKAADGGTACSVPLMRMNDAGLHGDLVILVSDNQSWIESLNIDRWGHRLPGKTALQSEWDRWKIRNPRSKLVCIDIAPYVTAQAQERFDILNIGGWSDFIFTLIDQFANGETNPEHLVELIEAIDLD